MFFQLNDSVLDKNVCNKLSQIYLSIFEKFNKGNTLDFEYTSNFGDVELTNTVWNIFINEFNTDLQNQQTAKMQIIDSQNGIYIFSHLLINYYISDVQIYIPEISNYKFDLLKSAFNKHIIQYCNLNSFFNIEPKENSVLIVNLDSETIKTLSSTPIMDMLNSKNIMLVLIYNDFIIHDNPKSSNLENFMKFILNGVADLYSKMLNVCLVMDTANCLKMPSMRFGHLFLKLPFGCEPKLFQDEVALVHRCTTSSHIKLGTLILKEILKDSDESKQVVSYLLNSN